MAITIQNLQNSEQYKKLKAWAVRRGPGLPSQDYNVRKYEDAIASGNQRKIAESSKNLVDALNVSLILAKREAQKADEVLTSGYDKNTPRYKNAIKNYEKITGIMPDFVKTDLPRIGSGFSKEMRVDVPGAERTLTPGTPAVSGATFQTAGGAGQGQPPAGVQGQGYIPGYKNIYGDQAQNPATSDMVNNLFQQYHNRPANQEEVGYWTQKNVGALEDTLAKTEIFGGEEADKIRAQMMASGQTYIRNQAELEQLAQAGQVSPEIISQVTTKTGMMFRPEAGAGTTGVGAPQIAGVDTGNWTTAMTETYNKTKQWLDEQRAAGKIVNPDITITPEFTQKYLTQAKTELDPYYNQLFSQAQQDIERETKRLAEGYGREERAIGEQYGRALESTQEEYARRGLGYSSRRTQAEENLAQQAREALEESKRQAGEAAEDIGIKGERYLGSKFFPQKLASIQEGAAPILGQPGVYGMTQGTAPRQLYTAQGGVYGTEEGQRTFDEQQRVRELTGAEREYRSEYYPNKYTFGEGEGFIGSRYFYS